MKGGFSNKHCLRRDSSVSVVTKLQYGRSGKVRTPADCTVSRTNLGPSQPTQREQAAVWWEVKGEEREAGPSSPETARANNTWSFISTPNVVI